LIDNSQRETDEPDNTGYTKLLP